MKELKMMTRMAEMILGSVPMPANFKYTDVFLKGRPQHNRMDDFSIKHPPMPVSRWAKIFSPFDALKGFNEAIGSKEVRYVDRAEIDGESQRDLNHKLSILHGYTYNSRMARANRVIVTVEYFVPCMDTDNFAFDFGMGQYEKMTGMVLGVDDVKEMLTLQTEDGKTTIDFKDILEITAQRPGLFDDVPEWCEP